MWLVIGALIAVWGIFLMLLPTLVKRGTLKSRCVPSSIESKATAALSRLGGLLFLYLGLVMMAG